MVVMRREFALAVFVFLLLSLVILAGWYLSRFGWDAIGYLFQGSSKELEVERLSDGLSFFGVDAEVIGLEWSKSNLMLIVSVKRDGKGRRFRVVADQDKDRLVSLKTVTGESESDVKFVAMSQVKLFEKLGEHRGRNIRLKFFYPDDGTKNFLLSNCGEYCDRIRLELERYSAGVKGLRRLGEPVSEGMLLGLLYEVDVYN